MAILALTLLASRPAAHHSPVMFDQQRQLTLDGVVTRLEWANPHVYLHLEARDGSGKPVLWIIESQSPRVMTLFGWSPASVSAGDRVVVAANPSRDGHRRTALGRSVTTPKGAVLRIPWEPKEIREALRADRSGRQR